MPQFGVGVAPPAGPIGNEISAVTRRAFLPMVYVQLWKSAPSLAAILATAQVATGGFSPITVPVQGNPMVTVQNVGYDASFNLPGVQPGLQNAEFALAGYLSAIPFNGFEGLQQVDYSVVPLIEARMNDVANVTRDRFAQDLFNNISNNAAMVGYPAAIDDGTFAANYGGINRSANPFWKSTYVHNGSPTAPTRNLMAQYIAQCTKATGERPTLGLCGFGTWTQLLQDFTTLERYGHPSPLDKGGEASSLFTALDVVGVPIYPDPYCPEGTLYLENTRYITAYIHERASFTMIDFQSMLPVGQVGWIGAVLTLIQLVDVKPKAHLKADNLQFLNI